MADDIDAILRQYGVTPSTDDILRQYGVETAKTDPAALAAQRERKAQEQALKTWVPSAEQNAMQMTPRALPPRYGKLGKLVAPIYGEDWGEVQIAPSIPKTVRDAAEQQRKAEFEAQKRLAPPPLAAARRGPKTAPEDIPEGLRGPSYAEMEKMSPGSLTPGGEPAPTGEQQMEQLHKIAVPVTKLPIIPTISPDTEEPGDVGWSPEEVRVGPLSMRSPASLARQYPNDILTRAVVMPLAKTAEGLATGENALIMAAMMYAPPLAAAIAEGKFTYDMAAGAIKTIPQINEAYQDGDWGKVAEGVSELAINGYFAGQTGRNALRAGRDLVQGARAFGPREAQNWAKLKQQERHAADEAAAQAKDQAKWDKWREQQAARVPALEAQRKALERAEIEKQIAADTAAVEKQTGRTLQGRRGGLPGINKLPFVPERLVDAQGNPLAPSEPHPGDPNFGEAPPPDPEAGGRPEPLVSQPIDYEAEALTDRRNNVAQQLNLGRAYDALNDQEKKVVDQLVDEGHGGPARNEPPAPPPPPRPAPSSSPATMAQWNEFAQQGKEQGRSPEQVAQDWTNNVDYTPAIQPGTKYHSNSGIYIVEKPPKPKPGQPPPDPTMTYYAHIAPNGVVAHGSMKTAELAKMDRIDSAQLQAHRAAEETRKQAEMANDAKFPANPENPNERLMLDANGQPVAAFPVTSINGQLRAGAQRQMKRGEGVRLKRALDAARTTPHEVAVQQATVEKAKADARLAQAKAAQEEAKAAAMTGQAPPPVAETPAPAPEMPTPVAETPAPTPETPTPMPETPAPATEPHEPTVPESARTIQAQLDQLAEGKRNAVQVPAEHAALAEAFAKGKPKLKVTPIGDKLYVHDKAIDPVEIQHLVNTNRLNELLGAADGGMGARTKAEIEASGEPAVAVVGRNEAGDETQGTVAGASDLPTAIAQTAKVADNVAVEDPAKVLAEREAANAAEPLPTTPTPRYMVDRQFAPGPGERVTGYTVRDTQTGQTLGTFRTARAAQIHAEKLGRVAEKMSKPEPAVPAAKAGAKAAKPAPPEAQAPAGPTDAEVAAFAQESGMSPEEARAALAAEPEAPAPAAVPAAKAAQPQARQYGIQRFGHEYAAVDKTTGDILNSFTSRQGAEGYIKLAKAGDVRRAAAGEPLHGPLHPAAKAGEPERARKTLMEKHGPKLDQIEAQAKEDLRRLAAQGGGAPSGGGEYATALINLGAVKFAKGAIRLADFTREMAEHVQEKWDKSQWKQFFSDAKERAADIARELSGRNPTGVGRTEDPLAEVLISSYESWLRDPEQVRKNVDTMREYPMFSDIKDADPRVAAEKMIDRMHSNLLYLYDKMGEVAGGGEEFRRRAKLWYDGANKLAKRWAEEHDVTPEQVAGAMAVTSPQTDWFVNADRVRRILDAWKKRDSLDWDERMEKTWAKVGGSIGNRYGIKLVDGKWTVFDKDSGEVVNDFARKVRAKAWAKEAKAQDLGGRRQQVYNLIAGKRFNEIANPYLRSVWLRLYDEATTSRDYRVLKPEGDFGDFALTTKGARRKAQWSDFLQIEKALSILEDGSRENIHRRLGNYNKIRNFYNNIVSPNSERGHVTMDTHAVGAGLFLPLAATSPEAGHNFGSTGASSSSLTGEQGTYGLNGEAYRRAAADRGVLPREMQSITWEGIRSLFSEDFKNKQKKLAKENPDSPDLVRNVWRDAVDGKITVNEARARITRLAGGYDKPEWYDGRWSSLLYEGDGLERGPGGIPGSEVHGPVDQAGGRPGRGDRDVDTARAATPELPPDVVPPEPSAPVPPESAVPAARAARKKRAAAASPAPAVTLASGLGGMWDVGKSIGSDIAKAARKITPRDAVERVRELLGTDEGRRRVFDKLTATAQRGAPEDAMVRLQHVYGGGVLNPVIEHVGDLTHRMAEAVTSDTGGYGNVKDKVDKTLSWLRRPYGFEREMAENIRNNAEARGVPVEELQAKIDAGLKAYGDAHADVPVFNRAQWLARQAAVEIGRKNFDSARLYLGALKDITDEGPEAWRAAAHEVDPKYIEDYESDLTRRAMRQRAAPILGESNRLETPAERASLRERAQRGSVEIGPDLENARTLRQAWDATEDWRTKQRTRFTDQYAALDRLVKRGAVSLENSPYVAARLFAGLNGKIDNRLTTMGDILKEAKKNGVSTDAINEYAELERHEELHDNQRKRQAKSQRRVDDLQAEIDLLNEEQQGKVAEARGKVASTRTLADIDAYARTHAKDVVPQELRDKLAAAKEQLKEDSQPYILPDREGQPQTIDDITLRKWELDEKMSPEKKAVLQKALDGVRQVSHDLLKDALDEGIIKQRDYDAIRAAGEKYVPLHRLAEIAEKLEKEGWREGGEEFSVAAQNQFKRIKGDKGEIVDPMTGIVKNIYSTLKLIERNKVARKTGELTFDPDFKGVVEPLLQTRKNARTGGAVTGEHIPEGYDKFSYLDKGKRVDMVAPQEVVDALKHMDEQSADIITKMASKTAAWARAGSTTYAIPFILTNLVRDFQTAMVTSANGKGMFNLADWARGAHEALKKGDDYKLFHEYGGSQSGYFEHQRKLATTVEDLTDSFADRLKKKPIGTIVKTPFELIRKAGEVVELAPRLGTFKKALAEGAGGEEAALRARNATVDFAKRGEVVKLLNMWVPFLNARWQGSLSIGRALKDNPVKTAMRLGASAMLPAAATYLWNRQQYPQVWNDIKQEDKDKFFVFIYGDHKNDKGEYDEVVKIPKGEGGQIVGGLVESSLAKAFQDPGAPSFAQTAAETASNISPINFMRGGKFSWADIASSGLPPALKAAAQWAPKAGYDFYRDKPLVTDRDKLMGSPRNQFDNRTGWVSKQVGDALDVSPAKLDMLAETLGGSLGRTVSHLGPDNTAGGSKALGNVGVPFVQAWNRFTKARSGEEEARAQAEDQEIQRVEADKNTAMKEESKAIVKQYASLPESQQDAYVDSVSAKKEAEIAALPEGPQRDEAQRKWDKQQEQLDKLMQQATIKMTPQEIALHNMSTEARARSLLKRVNALPPDKVDAAIKRWEDTGILSPKVSERMDELDARQ